MLLRSISGLRGTVAIDNNGLTPDIVVRYAMSFATWLGNSGTIALGYDGRKGGDVFYHLAKAAMRAAGCDVMALGVVPTPTVQMAAENEPGVVGGIAITASHNPKQWNGMKFIAGTGMFLDADENAEMWKIYDENAWIEVQVDKFMRAIDASSYIDSHVEAVLRIPFINSDKIAARKFKIVVDAVNCSGSRVVPTLLRALGVEDIIELYCDGSGEFPHTPEPIPQNLTSLKEAILREKADMGIVVDPDADRLVLIMENGEPFIEENTIVLAAEQVLRNSPAGQTVVVNLSTTRAVEDIASRYGGKVVRTPVGEINVAKRMKELGAIIGGEGSGGVILPSVHLGRDSLVGIALALSNLAEFDGRISEKKKSLSQYAIEKTKIALESADQVWKILRALETHFAPRAISMNHEDGLRIDFERSWIQARSSNTEPIIRIIAEATTREEAMRLIAEAEGLR